MDFISFETWEKRILYFCKLSRCNVALTFVRIYANYLSLAIIIYNFCENHCLFHINYLLHRCIDMYSECTRTYRDKTVTNKTVLSVISRAYHGRLIL